MLELREECVISSDSRGLEELWAKRPEWVWVHVHEIVDSNRKPWLWEKDVTESS